MKRALVVEREALGSMFDHMATLADPLRCRLLLLLERHELTVSELCAVLQLPQSTVSRHLKTLADAQWVHSRRDGTSRYYSLSLDELDDGARRLWPLIREQVASTAAPIRTSARLASVLGPARSKSEEFFSSASGQWDHLRDELFGQRVSSARAARSARSGVARRRSRLRHRTAHGARRAARPPGHRRRRLRRHAARSAAPASTASRGVDLRLGTLEALPIDDGQVDIVADGARAASPARSVARLEGGARASCIAAAAC